jgi:hypothetical protein
MLPADGVARAALAALEEAPRVYPETDLAGMKVVAAELADNGRTRGRYARVK